MSVATELEDDAAALAAVGRFIISGGFATAVAKFPTVQADMLIAIDETTAAAEQTVKALAAWKLAFTRAGQMIEQLKKAE